jgi:hypothetical protein
MHTLLAILLLLASITPARSGGLVVTATPELVRWSGAPAGCVYHIDPDGSRARLGCTYAAQYIPLPGDLYEGDLVEVRYPTPTGPRTGRTTVREEPMDISTTADAIAELVTAIATAGEGERRNLLTTLYKELQAAGLSEPAAAAIQHQVAQAAQGLGLATHTAAAEGDTVPAGKASARKV